MPNKINIDSRNYAIIRRIAIILPAALFGKILADRVNIQVAGDFASLATDLPRIGPLLVVPLTWIMHATPAQWIQAWSGPLTGALFGFFLADHWPLRGILERVLPDPPPFLDTRIEEMIARDKIFGRPPRAPFEGRGDAIAELNRLLDHPDKPFRWVAMAGPSGVGKTRLALEWLLRTNGWHYGVLATGTVTDRDIPDGWRSVRPTIVIVDEAERLGDQFGPILHKLRKASRAGRPIRVLMVDQVILQHRPILPNADDRNSLEVTKLPDIYVGLLKSPEILNILESESIGKDKRLDLVAACGGLPRAAILLARRGASGYKQEIIDWAEERIKRTQQSSMELLFVAAFSGPAKNGFGREYVKGFDVRTLTTTFPGLKKEDFDRMLPGIEPNDVAREIILSIASTVSEKDLKTLLESATQINPDSVDRTLGLIWLDQLEKQSAWDGNRDREDQRSQVLKVITNTCEISLVPQIKAARERVTSLVLAISDSTELDSKRRLLSYLEIEGNRRPYDPVVRGLQIDCFRGAIHSFGISGAFQELVHFSNLFFLLIKRHHDPAEEKRQELLVLRCICKHFASFKMFVDLEKWGDRLFAFDEEVAFDTQKAGAAFEAGYFYGESGYLNDVERWGARLDRLWKLHSSEVSVGREYAKFSMNAAREFGKRNKMCKMELWGSRVAEIASDFSHDREVVVQYLNCISNAALDYAMAAKFEDFERWANHLNGIADTFLNDPGLLPTQAKLFASAIVYYGRNEPSAYEGGIFRFTGRTFNSRFDDMERWGKRSLNLLHSFPNNPLISAEEVKAAAAAIAFYGLSNDWVGLERWAKRLTDVVERFPKDISIGEEEARGWNNAVFCYARASEIVPMERWFTVLRETAKRFPFNIEIHNSLASAAINAAAEGYYRLGRLAEMATVAETVSIISREFPFESSIRLREVQTANNLIVAGAENASTWRERLARGAIDFPECVEIQQIANLFGLSYVEQAKFLFPYGLPINMHARQ